MANRASPLPGALASGVLRFEKWRRDRTTPRIPEELWSLAAELGARYGVSRTARALRLQYYDVKKRVDMAPSSETDEAVTSPAFVEILTAPSSEVSECLVEFESAGGAKMRIQVKGAVTPDLAALSRLFLEMRP